MLGISVINTQDLIGKYGSIIDFKAWSLECSFEMRGYNVGIKRCPRCSLGLVGFVIRRPLVCGRVARFADRQPA